MSTLMLQHSPWSKFKLQVLGSTDQDNTQLASSCASCFSISAQYGLLDAQRNVSSELSHTWHWTLTSTLRCFQLQVELLLGLVVWQRLPELRRCQERRSPRVCRLEHCHPIHELLLNPQQERLAFEESASSPSHRAAIHIVVV